MPLKISNCYISRSWTENNATKSERAIGVSMVISFAEVRRGKNGNIDISVYVVRKSLRNKWMELFDVGVYVYFLEKCVFFLLFYGSRWKSYKVAATQGCGNVWNFDPLKSPSFLEPPWSIISWGRLWFTSARLSAAHESFSLQPCQ